MKIQLITFAGCPNADGAREALLQVLSKAAPGAMFEEIDSTAAETPENLREWGSPTVLIDGVDVGGQEGPSGRSCRLYRDAAGNMSGSLPEQLLRDAIQRARRAVV